jgi:hypothetical protein
MRLLRFLVAIVLTMWSARTAHADFELPQAQSMSPSVPQSATELPRGAPLALVDGEIPVSASGLPFAARNGSIIVFAKPSLQPRASDLAAHANEYLQRIVEDLPGLPLAPSIEVRLVDDATELNQVAPPNRPAPAYAIGVAYPDLGILAVATRRGGIASDPAETLRHELAHVALGAALGPWVPRWLHEGFAYQHSGEWTFARAETLAGMAWGDNIVGLRQLEATFPDQEQPAGRAYAQSYDFVGYLSRRGRWEDTDDDGDRWPFRRFLVHIAQHHDVDAAAVAAFGRPINALFEEWRSDLKNRYMMVPIGVLVSALWVLGALMLVFGWWRKRRQNRRRIAQWDDDDRKADIVRQQQAAEQAAARHEWVRIFHEPTQQVLTSNDDDEHKN